MLALSLTQRLDLEQLDDNLFRGVTPNDGRPRIFGGLVAAQALTAATRTVEKRDAHSLHSYFLRSGDPTVPVIYEVDRIRDGRSMTTRRVTAIQHGEAIFNLAASFHDHEPGLEFQLPMPATPPPGEFPDAFERLDNYIERSGGAMIFRFLRAMERPIEQRDVDHVDLLTPERFVGEHRTWMKAAESLPDDVCTHQGVLTYASDLSLLSSSLFVHGRTYNSPDLMFASLDHSIWFHRPFRADEWVLYVAHCSTTSAARGLNLGRIYRADGTHVATVVQECMLRVRDPNRSSSAEPSLS